MAKQVGLTRRQAELLGFLRRHYLRSTVAPTYHEIMTALDLGSKCAVHRLVVALEDRGHIIREPGKARSIALTNPPAQSVPSHAVTLPAEIEAQLQRLATETKMPPQRIIAEAVRSYIMEGV